MAVETDLTGQTIGERYSVKSLLGEGAMGSVYLAEDTQLEREVALKVLRKEWVSHAEILKRLENECRILARLSGHPHIVTLYDRLVYNQDIVLVMEYVRGETLADILDRTSQFTQTSEGKRATVPVQGAGPVTILEASQAIQFMLQCLDALSFAHAQGIIHRDIKPSNILITQDHNNNAVAKIMDFGIGKAFQEAGDETAVTALTRAGSPGPGTPAYMAPEQIDPVRFGQVGPWTDIYALGITFYEMLTMTVPFDGTYTELLHKQTNVEPPDPRDRNPSITDALQRVLIKALQKNPADRYQSASEFQSDLQALGGGTLVQAPPARSSGPGGAVAAAPRKTSSVLVPVLLACVAMLIFAGGGVYYYFFYFNAGSGNEGATTQSTTAADSSAPSASAPAAGLPASGAAVPASAGALPPEITLGGHSPTNAEEVTFNVTGAGAPLDAKHLKLQGSLTGQAGDLTISGQAPRFTVSVPIPADKGDGSLGLAVLKDDGSVAATSPPYTIDHTPPTATISSVGKLTTDANSVTFKVSFSESVGSSFTPSDAELTGDLASKAVFQIKPSDPLFDVVATTQDATASGKLGLAIKPDVVKDLAGNPFKGASSDFEYTIEHVPGNVTVASGNADAARAEADKRFDKAKAKTDDSGTYQQALKALNEAQTLKMQQHYSEAAAKYKTAAALFGKAKPAVAASPAPKPKPKPTPKPKTASASPLGNALSAAESAKQKAFNSLTGASQVPEKTPEYVKALDYLAKGKAAEKKGDSSAAAENYKKAAQEFGSIKPNQVVFK